MLKLFEIEDHEIATKTIVRAQGYLEAIAEYLPWATLQVDVIWQPTYGQAVFTDRTTDFRYTVSFKN
ncbi:hypothetical protein [Vibrio agarivorans]|uniref:hypothetical protein n=1 Tax=Vibrio agarivorans TaxID=153622 RepID=UPI0025B2CFD9|nr:hypothetical protein [Vibrio agarivorans]MDN3661043.1 hypothetical protein [Vibrio agarivorans]